MELSASTSVPPVAEFCADRIDRFLGDSRPRTPCLVLDLEIVREKYRSLAALLPGVEIFYAVKANPAPAVIDTLARLGASFDLASEGEISRCRRLGVPATSCSFGNTIKREVEIADAWRAGIDLFAFDSLAEIEKLARAAPGARVYCRLTVAGKGAEWPLSRKFGCAPEMAADLLLTAGKLGLRPFGVSFHVGSQQTEPDTWTGAIARAARVFRDCARSGIALEIVNLGGGLPAQYRAPIPALGRYAEVIRQAIDAEFGTSSPRLFIEPGRYLVGDAGLLRSEVVLISRRTPHAHRPWVYLDAGRFNGLPETIGERIRYRIRTPRDPGVAEPMILAGPTCDSADIIYQDPRFNLPCDLAIGDPVDFLSAGAYTASYASVEFNGFTPIQTYCI